MNKKFENIDFQEVIFILRKHLSFILLITAVFGLSALFISKFLITPKYEVKSSLIVNSAQDSSQIDLAERISAYQKLVDDYVYIIKSETVAKQVIQNLNLNMTTKQLLNEMSIKGVDSTDIMELAVTDIDPVRAQIIVNEIDKVAPGVIMDMVASTVSVKIITNATINDQPISPKLGTNTLIGLILGFIISSLITFGREYLDNTFKTDDDIKDILDITILGVIPFVEGIKK